MRESLTMGLKTHHAVISLGQVVSKIDSGVENNIFESDIAQLI